MSNLTIQPNQLQMISMQVLGSAMGGPIAALMGGAGNLPQLGQLLSPLAGMFGGASPAANFSARPQAFSMNINLTIVNNPMQQLAQPSGQAQTHFAKAPTVGGEGDWPGFNKAVNDRMTGSSANKSAMGMDGNIWTNGKGNLSDKAAIGWAMQQDDRLRFNADTKQFFVTNQDGSTQNVCSLQQMSDMVNKNGGANQNNGAGFASIGSFIQGLLQNLPAGNAGGAAGLGGGAATGLAGGAGAAQQANANNPMQQLMDLLNKLIQVLSGKAGAAGGAGAASGLGGASGTGGSGGVSSGGGVSGGDSVSGGSGSGGASSIGGGDGGLDSMVDSVGGSIDKMMGDAEGLMKSDKQSDQLKGQMMMQKAMRLFEMISKLLEQRSQMASKAIQAIK